MDEINFFRFSILGVAFVSSLIGIQVFRKLAIRFNIVARKNHRTLHVSDTPKGSGIVFSLVFISLVYVIWQQGYIPCDLVVAICVGGLVATLFGFIDDILNVPAKIKLIVQVLLSSFIVLWFGEGVILLSVEKGPIDIGIMGMFVSVFILVWLLNLYNFMDGVDGMAASGTVFICAVIAAVLFFVEVGTEVSLVAAVLATSCFAFLLFNWPTAKIFMGDAGSVFIGYFFGCLIIYTMMLGYISVWTWVIIFGYFGVDTTITLLLRIYRVKKWYGAHRSHAYQNLARIWDSHSRILCLVICYHLVWILPLTVLSVVYAQYQEVICFFAVFPVVLWTLKYGPLLSSD